MSEALGAGYLAQVEANRIGIRPGPNVVYLRLTRDFEGERQVRSMFSELTPGHAQQLIWELEAAVRVALNNRAEGDASRFESGPPPGEGQSPALSP